MNPDNLLIDCYKILHTYNVSGGYNYDYNNDFKVVLKEDDDDRNRRDLSTDNTVTTVDASAQETSYSLSPNECRT